MKRLVLLISIIGLFVFENNIFARNFSKFVLDLPGNDYFLVTFDNVAYEGSRVIEISGLRRGDYPIAIYRYVQVHGRRMSARGKELVYSGYVSVSHSSYISAKLHRNGMFTYNTRRKHNDGWADNGYYNGNNGNDDYCDNNNNNNYNNGHSHGHCNIEPVCQHDFDNILNAVDRRSFDREKLELMDVFLNQHYFNTYQLGLILSRITFDNNQVEFLKRAYRKCVDKSNYFNLIDRLTFTSSKREVENYILNIRC